MSAIPWITLSGEMVQKIIEIYICKTNPGATAIRPSHGDKGIDVCIDNEDGSLTVFQIKKFAQTLKTTQKRQIKESWETLKKYVEEEGKVLSEWHLVMPLNPTIENKKWLDELTADAECKVFWDGLTIVESWAAEMPEVAEYYLFNGQERAQELFVKALSIMRRQSAAEPDAIIRSLQDCCELLDELDPNYSYSFHVLSKYDSFEWDVNVLSTNPGLIMAQERWLPNGTRIRIDMLARYPLATSVEPIDFCLELLANNEMQKDQIERFIEMGVPLDRIPAHIKDLNDSLLFGGISPDSVVEVRSFSLTNDAPIVAICMSAGVGSIDLQQKDFTSGTKGMHWEGCDSSGIMQVVIEAKIGSAWTLSLKFIFDEDERPLNSRVQRLFNFLYSWRQQSNASLIVNGKHAAAISFDSLSISSAFIDCGYELSNALSIIDLASSRDVRFPKMGSLSNLDVSIIRSNAKLIEDGMQEVAFDKLEFGFGDNSCPIDAPSVLLIVQELSTPVGDEVYRCGYLEAAIPVGQIIDGEKNKAVIVPTTEYGNMYIRKVVQVGVDELDCVNKIMVRKIESPEDWISFKHDYMNQQPIE